ncbi:hypothetical protein [Chryseobacterium bernardetii]|uniref:hypothetical protein n=1 Tax=Chryseobacterium bernardetii TaxID=1241978 RepID=UPI000F506386|nr:hypothetical protein [Chryseobacterium bernardetii]
MLKIVGGGIDPETGYPTEPTEQWVFHSNCRDEVVVQQGIVTLESGEVANYSSKVLMPLGTPIIEANTQIEVRSGNQIRSKGKILRFAPTQLHCRLWV